ncbi:MAG: CAP domain-containing protein [Leucothrix sp.]
MANSKVMIGVAVAAGLLLSGCMGREGVVGQQGVVGTQGLAGQGAGNVENGGNERRGLFGQQVRKPKNEEPVPNLEAKEPQKVITAKERFAGTVAAHNVVRTKKRLAGLVWSDTLAGHAQEWADHLAKVNNCQLNHRPNSGEMKREYGENLWWAGADVWSDGSRRSQTVTIEKVVSAWASEAANYNYDANSCQPGKQCNNYTQIMWQDTTSVGCGYQQCEDKSQVWVCNYNPPGNFVDKKPY